MTRVLLAGVLCAASAFAEQALSAGVIGGAPFTDVVSATTAGNLSAVSTSSNFTVGPAVQVNLPLSLRVEADALYRPYSFSETIPGSILNISAAQWTFPILLQYRFQFPVVKPFVSAGMSFDHLAQISSAAHQIVTGPGQLANTTTAGFVLGGGVDVKVPLVRLSAELRYTHQASDFFTSLSNTNQAEFLVGVHF